MADTVIADLLMKIGVLFDEAEIQKELDAFNTAVERYQKDHRITERTEAEVKAQQEENDSAAEGPGAAQYLGRSRIGIQ